MPARRSIISLLVALVLWPAAAGGQSPALNDAYERYSELNAQSRYQEAIPYAEEALRLAELELGLDNRDTAHLVNNLAGLYHNQRRYGEAEPLYVRALAIFERSLGPDHPDVALCLNNLAELYRDQGRYAEAEPLYKRSLVIRETVLGPDHPDVAQSLNNMALLYDHQGRYAEAEPHNKRMLAILEKALGPDHPSVAVALNNMAQLYNHQGRYAEAEPLYKRTLAIRETVLGPDHPDVAVALNNLAELYHDQGSYVGAEPLYVRALAIFERSLGPAHPYTAMALGNLAGIYMAQGQYAEAEPLFGRALAITETAFDSDHPDVAFSLNNLAGLYQGQGRYAEAEPLYQRSLAIREAALGPDHPSVAVALNNLAQLYSDQGRYAEAEPLNKRTLAISEKTLGPDHPDTAVALGNLAGLYRAQGRYAEAEPLFRRALAIQEKVFEPEHPSVAVALNNMALLYDNQGRYAEAEPLYERSLAIQKTALGPDHPDVAVGLNNLSSIYQNQGRYAEAEPLIEQALAISEKALGPDHPDVARRLYNFAQLYLKWDKAAEAEPLYKRALAITEKAFPIEHPTTVRILENLAHLYGSHGDFVEAVDHIRRATVILRGRLSRLGVQRTGAGLREQRSHDIVFKLHVQLVYAMAMRDPERLDTLTAEAFEVGQLAQARSAAQALLRMAARFGARDDDLGRTVRARQDALDRWQNLDQRLTEAVSESPEERDVEAEARLRSEIEGADLNLNELDKVLAAEFPDYAELATPKPETLANIQKLLGPQEALISYVVAEDMTFLWVVRRGQAEMFRLAISHDDLDHAVVTLRGALDPTGLRMADIPPFDLELAFDLYNKLLAPAEPLLEGVRHLFLVPDGALQSLPLGVLVTEKPEAINIDYSTYRQTAWLARKYAVSVLPSVSSLRALRVHAMTSGARKPFLGIGDPVLMDHPDAMQQPAVAQADAVQSKWLIADRGGVDLAKLFRGGLADIDMLNELPSLPETAEELDTIATSLGAGPESLVLRENAAEPLVRGLPFSDYRVIAFATHAAIAGELDGLAEPGLILTPPETATELDDGVLTASEIAGLDFDADLVILSACNTASDDGRPGAEGLSGLAKAFFYAGTRALLVSHWAVVSNAATQLTTGMFRETAATPGIGRAEALRRAMLALMNDPGAPYFAHPMFWAPFVVVGEGGAI